jgi:hypothetical protein
MLQEASTLDASYLCLTNLQLWPVLLLSLRNRFRFVDDWISHVFACITELEFEKMMEFGAVEVELVRLVDESENA